MQDKLVIVTRKDLSYGQQAVQCTHAACNFIFEFPNKASPWFKSNYIIQLAVDNEEKLKRLIWECEQLELDCTVFREPDIGNLIAAIAIEPSPITQKLVKKLKLLFKDESI